MRKIIGLLLAFVCAYAPLHAKDSFTKDAKYQEDKATILKLAGCFQVQFSFSETFAPDTGYKYHNRKFETAQELVILIENTDKKISFQHLLLVGDGMIVKHWRQDWIYENQDIYNYEGDNVWKKTSYSPDKVKGTWTQKVYHVDDGPRYEGLGTWVHVDGRHFWESTTDAPLPRREYTTRNDYNVLKRGSHMEVTDSGWVLDQDNQKIIRKAGKDQLLCMEKGIESFKTDPKTENCQEGVDYWKENSAYWNDVRKVWEKVFATHNVLKLKLKVDGKPLYEYLFSMAENATKEGTYNSTTTLPQIEKVINSFIE